MRRVRVLCSLVVISAFAFAACDDDGGPKALKIDSEVATLAIHENLETHLMTLAEALVFVGESTVVQDTFRLVQPVGEEPEPWVPEPDGSGGGDGELVTDFRDAAADVAAFFRDKVFIPGHIEASSDTAVTYLIPAAVICELLGVEAYEDEWDDELSDCLDFWGPMELRVVARSYTEGDIDLEFLITADKHKPLRLSLHRARVAFEIDLRALKSTIEAAGKSFDSAFALPGSVAGKVRFELTRHGAKDFSVQVGVVQKIALDIEGVVAQIDAAPNAMQMRIDGQNRRVEGSVDMKRVYLKVPWKSGEMSCEWNENLQDFDCYETSTEEMVMEIDLAGASGAVSFNAGDQRIDVQGVGLGSQSSVVKLDGKVVLTLDVNKDAGRRFDLSIEPGAAGPIFSVTPSFELLMGMSFQAVADKMELESWMGDDVLGIALLDQARIEVLQEGGMRVLQGAMKLWSNSHTVNVSAGECLLETGEGGDDVHPAAGMEVGACP